MTSYCTHVCISYHIPVHIFLRYCYTISYSSNMNRLPPILLNDVELFNSQLQGAICELAIVQDKFMVTKGYLDDLFQLANMKPLNNSEDMREKTINLFCDIIDEHFYTFLDDLKAISHRSSNLHTNVKHLNCALFDLTKKLRDCMKPTVEPIGEISTMMKPVDPIALTNQVLKAKSTNPVLEAHAQLRKTSAFPTVEQMELIDMNSLETNSDKDTGMSVDDDVEVDEDNDLDDASHESSAYDTVTRNCDNIPDLNNLTLSQEHKQRTLDDYFSLCSTKKK